MKNSIISHENNSYLKQCLNLTIQQVEEIVRSNVNSNHPFKIFFLFKACSLNKEAIGNFDFEKNEIVFSFIGKNEKHISPIRKNGPTLPHFPFEIYKYTLLRELTKDKL